MTSKWIPVTERMPEADGDYIVTTNRGKTTIRMFCGGEWMTAGKILAWMPLPEAYRADGDTNGD